jgi:hypothetical protein
MREVAEYIRVSIPVALSTLHTCVVFNITLCYSILHDSIQRSNGFFEIESSVLFVRPLRLHLYGQLQARPVRTTVPVSVEAEAGGQTEWNAWAAVSGLGCCASAWPIGSVECEGDGRMQQRSEQCRCLRVSGSMSARVVPPSLSQLEFVPPARPADSDRPVWCGLRSCPSCVRSSFIVRLRGCGAAKPTKWSARVGVSDSHQRDTTGGQAGQGNTRTQHTKRDDWLTLSAWSVEGATATRCSDWSHAFWLS